MSDSDWLDVALLALRLWAGIVMLAHGVNHGRSLEGTGRWFARVGFRQPRLNALLSAGAEVGIGLALVAGLFTSVAAAGLAATMAVAFWTIHRFAGFFVFHRPDEGYEYVATMALVAFALAVAGPGSVSADAAFGWADELDGVTGLIVYLSGLGAAAAQLAVFWRRPGAEERP